MPASIKKIALVLLIAALPLQALAAIVIPLCRQDVATAHDHAQHDGHEHDHDAPAQDHDHPLAANDLGSDHCSAGSAFAPVSPQTFISTLAVSDRMANLFARKVDIIIPQPASRSGSRAPLNSLGVGARAASGT